MTSRAALPFVLNHITAPLLSYREFFAVAHRLGCTGVELRNDLERPLFDGDGPETVAKSAREYGLRIVGLSQVYPFNAWSDDIRTRVALLIETAKACGAETISLIPRNDGQPAGDLRIALREIAPMLADAGLVALVEPLGFESSSLRSKAETIEAFESVGVARHFKLVHDTFHHHLAGEAGLFPSYTGLVHISGVTDPSLSVSAMRDEHRVLVDAEDRLGNCAQIAALRAGGYEGPISFEAFSPAVHCKPDLEDALRRSMDFVSAEVAARSGMP